MALESVGSKGLLTLSGLDLVRFVQDMRAVQVAADSAIGDARAGALQDAKDDATARFGGIPSRVTAVEAKNVEQDAAIVGAASGAVADAKAYADERDEVFRTVDRALWREEDDAHQVAAEANAKTYTDAETGKDRTRLAAVELKNTEQDATLGALQTKNLPAGADLDAYRTPALEAKYRIPDNAVYDSLLGAKPSATATPGYLTVKALTSGAAWQEFRGWYGTDDILYRVYSPLNFGGFNAWSPWRVLASTDDVDGMLEPLRTKEIPSGLDIDAMRTPAFEGKYRVPNNTVYDSLGGAKPYPAATPGFLTVEALTSGAAWQQFKAWYGTDDILYRVYAPLSLNGFFQWSPWKTFATVTGVKAEIAATTPTLPPRHSHQTRREMMVRRKGGAIPTAGKGAFCLRLDHGFVNVRDKVLPLLAKYGIPASVAVNSSTLNVAGESEGVTYANLAQWGKEYGLDYANHSLDHGDATTTAAMEATIVGNLTQMRAGLPDHAIDVYMMPGVSGTKYNAFDAGADLTKYFSHPAGRLMLDNHGLAAGETAGKNIPLVGQPFNGIGWHTLDVNSWITAAKTQIQYCETRGLGMVGMLHPSFLDTVSRTTLAQFESFLAWLAVERDAGRLLLLTQAGLAVADAGRSNRINLVPATSGSLPRTATVPLGGQEWLRGGIIEAQVTVAGAVGDVVSVSFGGYTRNATLTATSQTIYRQTVAPLTGTGDMAVTVAAVTGAPTLTSVNVHPV